MSDKNLEALGLDAAVIDKAEAQEVRPAFKALPSEVYDAKIKELATFTSSKGAGMLKVVVNITDQEDTDITIYQNVKKKDGSANEIGQATFRHILDACNKTSADIAVKAEEITAYGKKVPGNVVKGLDKIPFKACVRQIFTEGSKYEDSNEIDAYLRADGTNAKGENLVDTFKEKIAKNPILKRVEKGQGAGGSSGGNTSATQTSDGKAVDEML